MRSRSLQIIATLFALPVIGCVAEATSSDPTDGPVTITDHVHKMPIRDRGNLDGTLQAGSIAPMVATAGAHLTYNGGKIIQNVAITQVLYGSGTYIPELTSTTGVNMESAYTQMVTSGVFDWLSEYNTTSPAQTIGRGTYEGSVQITPASSRNGSTISDASIQAELAAQIRAGMLPPPTDNDLYMVHFPAGKTITQGKSSSCSSGGFCAYHGTFKIGSQNVYYGVLPALVDGCETGCGAGTTFENQQSVSSHELIEAVTDAEVGLATVLGPPLAWYDTDNGEIGDICNAQHDTFTGTDGETYTIQKEFSNQENDCITTRTVSTTQSLGNDVSVSNLSGASNSHTFFKLSVPPGRSRVVFQIRGGSGDADLYVKRGAKPTTSDFDCRPFLSGSRETCTFNSPRAGNYFVMLRGFSTYSGVKLVGHYR